MELRKFTDAGLRTFEDFLDSCNTDTPRAYPAAALTDALESEPVQPAVQITPSAVATRLELAKQLDDALAAGGFHPARSDKRLWAWLACLYFPHVCTKSSSGKWKPGQMARWIPRSNDFRRYYRHLLAGPYFIYREYLDDPNGAMAVLCQKPGSPGDVVEQLVSRQQLITNRAIMQVASDLYVDPQTGLQRKGAQSKKATWGVLRFRDVLGQFDVTWDLSMLTTEGLYELLPDEFHGANQ